MREPEEPLYGSAVEWTADQRRAAGSRRIVLSIIYGRVESPGSLLAPPAGCQSRSGPDKQSRVGGIVAEICRPRPQVQQGSAEQHCLAWRSSSALKVLPGAGWLLKLVPVLTLAIVGGALLPVGASFAETGAWRAL